ncbi:MAG: cell division protein ZapB [Desulfovibrio sp.]|nr:cell division protein ZapB [Desulfovibrio sp.]
MTILEQLDTEVTSLLQTIHALKAENANLRFQLESKQALVAALEETNHSLAEAVKHEEAVRTKALTHIDMLLSKLQDYKHKN